MPSIFGIPLIGFIQIVIGVAVVSFVLIKYIFRPKKRREEGQYIINDAHIIVGDGSELNHQYVYIKDGIIKEISDKPISIKMFRLLMLPAKHLCRA